MNFSPKFYKRGFFIFGIFNFLLVGLILFAPNPKPDHRSPLKHVVEKLNDILSLNSKQQLELQKIFDFHQKEIDSLKKITEQNRQKSFNCLRGENGICDSTLFFQPGFEMVLFKHHQRILKILTKKQQEKYLLELKSDKPKGPPPF